MTPITASALHALFEPIRAAGWDGWPFDKDDALCPMCGYDAMWPGWGHDDSGRTADLLLAAALRWLATRDDGISADLISPYGRGLHWGVQFRPNANRARQIHSGPTPYHAAAAALRAAMGMEALK